MSLSCLSLYVCLFNFLSFSACLPCFLCLSVCLSLSLYLCLSFYVCLFVYLFLSVSLSVCLFVCLSLSLSLCLSFSFALFLSVCLFLSICVQAILCSDTNVGGYSTDEPNKFLVPLDPHTAVPFFLPAGRLQGPAKELTGIVKTKHIVLILNIILIKKCIELQ